MRMKKKSSIIITSIIIVIIFISCFHNGNSAATISYENMPSEIKDSIESIITHIKIDKIPILICFSGDFSLKNQKIGPWVLCRVVTNNKTHREYRLPTNSSTPIIIDSTYIYIFQVKIIFFYQAYLRICISKEYHCN